MAQTETEAPTTETKPSEWTLKQTLVMLAFITVSVSLAAFFSLAGEPPGERTGSLVFFVIFAVFLFVMVRFEAAVRLYNKFFLSYFRLTGGVFVMTLPLLLFSWLSGVMLASFPLWLQIVCFSVWGILLGGAIVMIATKRRRNSLLAPLQKFSIALPAVYSFQVLMLASLFFSTVCYVMSQYGKLTFTSPWGKPVTAGLLSDFFFWHFLDAVPLLKVNETLNWEAPLTYDTTSVGWILLLFKAVVIIPVISAFTWYGTHEEPAKENATQQSELKEAAAGQGTNR